MSSEISNSSCQRKQSPRREDHLTSKVSNHLSQEVDSAVIEEAAVEEEVVALAEVHHVVSEEAAVLQEEVVVSPVEAEVDIELFILIKMRE